MNTKQTVCSFNVKNKISNAFSIYQKGKFAPLIRTAVCNVFFFRVVERCFDFCAKIGCFYIDGGFFAFPTSR